MGDLLNQAKGQFAQSLVTTLLEGSGYRVQRLGVEDVLGEVKGVSSRGEGYLGLPAALWALPDLLVIDHDGPRVAMVEVKFRSVFDERTARALHAGLSAQHAHWPGTYTVLVVAQAPVGDSGRRYQDHIRVVRPEQLDGLGADAPPDERWSSLATFGAVFARVHECDGFHVDADRLVPVLRAWAARTP